MPFTPYHFGPSGFIALALRKWLDLPVFLLANVIIDIEVLVINALDAGFPIHRYAHTLLIGGIIGALWGMTAYPLRGFFQIIMRFFRLPYQTTFSKMLISGVFGFWLHVIIDSIYHWDVRPFWPASIKPLFGLLTQNQVEIVSLAFFILAVILYIIIVVSHRKKNETVKSEKIKQ